jgi:phage shock protein PspC (stress-responsive transcriptional regulator)
MIAGVATGMADAFHVDVLVIRVLWVIAALAGGLGVAAYVVCWLAFPSDAHPAPLSHAAFRGRNRRRNAIVIAALVLIGLGFVNLFGEIWAPFRHGGELAWAFLLIAGGAAVLLFRHPDEERADSPPAPPLPPTPPRDDSPPPSEPDPAASTTTAPPPAAPYPPDAPVPPQPPTTSAWTQHAPWPAPPPVPPRVRRPRPRPFLTPLTISLLLIGAGVAALLDAAGWVHLTVAGVLASGLILVGAALVLSAWFGRARGLIPIGILLLLVTIPAATIDVPISGGIGERDYHPTAAREVRSSYELGIGHLSLDLRDVPLTDGITRVKSSLGIGELDVDVPADTQVDVTAHAGAGATDIFGRVEGGWPQDTHRSAGPAGTGVLYLDLRVGAGSVKVRRWTPDGSFITMP